MSELKRLNYVSFDFLYGPQLILTQLDLFYLSFIQNQHDLFLNR